MFMPLSVTNFIYDDDNDGAFRRVVGIANEARLVRESIIIINIDLYAYYVREFIFLKLRGQRSFQYYIYYFLLFY